MYLWVYFTGRQCGRNVAVFSRKDQAAPAPLADDIWDEVHAARVMQVRTAKIMTSRSL
jgi:hypothetical protein